MFYFYSVEKRVKFNKRAKNIYCSAAAGVEPRHNKSREFPHLQEVWRLSACQDSGQDVLTDNDICLDAL